MSDQATDTAVKLGEEFEGFSAKPYLCPAHVWTIGFGSTRDKFGNPVTANTPDVTREDAEALMARDLRSARDDILTDVKVPLTPQEDAALMDFIYNLGGGAFRSSTLLRKLNMGDFTGASEEFDKWDHADGVVMAGLLRRREAERKLFQS